jgi:hypothetical protein
MTIKFTEKEMQDLRELASSRNNKAPGVIGKDLGVPSESSHFYGVVTEAAVAKAFGVQMNREIYKNGGDKHAADLTVPNIGTVEVKSVTEKYKGDPWLKVPVKTFNEDIEYYVLTTTTFADREVRIVGYATKEMVKSATQRRTKPEFPLNYELRESDLLDFNDLLAMSKGEKPKGEKVKATTSKSPETIKEEVIYEVKSQMTATPFSDLKPGDVVTLNPETIPTMVISKIDNDVAHCVYFNGGRMMKIDLSTQTLKLVSQ